MRALAAIALLTAPAAALPPRLIAAGAPPPEPGVLMLTFDDGPSWLTTPTLLDTLDRYGVHATFFVNGYRFVGEGDQSRRNREVLLEERRRGHVIGNHTFSHPNLGALGGAQQRWQIQRNAEAIERMAGVSASLFRPPYGVATRAASEFVAAHGWTKVLWDIEPQDHLVRDSRKVFARTLAQAHARGGGIVLMHDPHLWSVRATEMLLGALLRESCRALARGGQGWRFGVLGGVDGAPAPEDVRPLATPARCPVPPETASQPPDVVEFKGVK